MEFATAGTADGQVEILRIASNVTRSHEFFTILQAPLAINGSLDALPASQVLYTIRRVVEIVFQGTLKTFNVRVSMNIE